MSDTYDVFVYWPDILSRLELYIPDTYPTCIRETVYYLIYYSPYPQYMKAGVLLGIQGFFLFGIRQDTTKTGITGYNFLLAHRPSTIGIFNVE